MRTIPDPPSNTGLGKPVQKEPEQEWKKVPGKPGFLVNAKGELKTDFDLPPPKPFWV